MFNNPLALTALIIALTLAAPTPARADGLLPLVTVRDASDGDAVLAFWWSAPGGALSEVERALTAAAERAGVAVIDPARAADPPRISRLYRRPELTASNATNLGGLFGASAVVVGEVELRGWDGAAEVGLSGCEVRVAVSLFAVDSRREVARVALTRRAFEEDPRVAREAALKRALTDAGDLLAARVGESRASAAVGLDDRGEPYMVVTGLWTMDALTALQRKVAERAGSVAVAWVAPGLVGLDVDPGRAQSSADIDAIARALVSDPPDGMRLTPTSGAPGSTWLAAERAPLDDEPGDGP